MMTILVTVIVVTANNLDEHLRKSTRIARDLYKRIWRPVATGSSEIGSVTGWTNAHLAASSHAVRPIRANSRANGNNSWHKGPLGLSPAKYKQRTSISTGLSC